LFDKRQKLISRGLLSLHDQSCLNRDLFRLVISHHFYPKVNIRPNLIEFKSLTIEKGCLLSEAAHC